MPARRIEDAWLRSITTVVYQKAYCSFAGRQKAKHATRMKPDTHMYYIYDCLPLRQLMKAANVLVDLLVVALITEWI